MVSAVVRTHGHGRPQIRAPNADVDDVGDAVVGAHPFGKVQHGCLHGMHLGQQSGNFRPIARQGEACGPAQQGMQHGALLGGVDRIAAQHGVALPGDAGGPGQLLQQRFGLARPEVLGQIGKHLGSLLAEVREALGVARKGLAQVQRTPLCIEMGLQTG